MSIFPITKFINCDVQTDVEDKWNDFVDGGNGFLYGIPQNASRVLQLDLEDKSLKEIGPNLDGENFNYGKGIRAENGSIYCMPGYRTKFFLKITPMEGGDAKVQILKDKPLPRQAYSMWKAEDSWEAGCLARDGCIYYMPISASRILKLDTSNGDNLSLVEDSELPLCKCAGSVLGGDGCVYGLPYLKSSPVFKFDPAKILIMNMGCLAFDFASNHHFRGDVLANDGNVYTANRFGQVIQLDLATNDVSIFGSKLFNDDDGCGWGYPVIGANKCIYFPPYDHDRVLKFNPITQKISLIGNSHGNEPWKWVSGVLASDGIIYCVPFNAKHILQIDSRHINEQVIEFVEGICARHECAGG